MAVVAIDRSGNFTDAAFWVVAVREEFTQEQRIQEHRALEISKAEFDNYKKKCDELNYREKISAAFIFESLRPIIRREDSVQIDMDFLGQRREQVRRGVKRLINKFKNIDPAIEFHSIRSEEGKKHIKLADKKSRLARHKELKNPSVKKCPDLSTYLDDLKSY